MGEATILLVEDCADTARAVRSALGRDHDLVVAGDVGEARRLAAGAAIDLALIDLGLPDGSGFEVCQLLREREPSGLLPVIFLTASRDTRDKVTAFQLDAEDYVEKPFDPLELRARVEARLRRRRRDDGRGARIVLVGDLQLDALAHRVWLAGGDELHLTPHEFQLLHLLGARAGEVVSRACILETVWRGVAVTARTVDTHVSNLRRKLREQGGAFDLEAVRGVGYRLRVAED